MTDFLKHSSNNKIGNIKDFTWKLKKEQNTDGTFSQDFIRLIDASEDQLRQFISHCNSMLYNTTDKIRPGRCVLLEQIKDQINKCTAELFKRALDEKNLSSLILIRLNEFIERTSAPVNITKLIDTEIFEDNGSLDYEYAELTIDYILDALMGKLGQFDKRHLTLTFFLKQGIWFTREEILEMNDSDLFAECDSDRIEYVRRYLNVPKISKIYFNPKGLSLNEMKIALDIKSKLYKFIPSEQLILLKDRLLYDLIDDVRFHIQDWEKRIEQIKAVAKHNGYKV